MSENRSIFVRIINGDDLRDDVLKVKGLTDFARGVIRRTVGRAVTHGFGGDAMPLLLLWSILEGEKRVGFRMIAACANGPLLSAEVSRLLLTKAEVLDFGRGKRAVRLLDLFQLSRLVRDALAEAAKRQHSWVSTEHMVLALANTTEPQILDIMHQHGLDYDRLDSSMRSLLDPLAWMQF